MVDEFNEQELPEEQPYDYEQDEELEQISAEQQAQLAHEQELQQRVFNMVEQLPDLDNVEGWEVAAQMAQVTAAIDTAATSLENLLSIARTAELETKQDMVQVLTPLIDILDDVPLMVAYYMWYRFNAMFRNR